MEIINFRPIQGQSFTAVISLKIPEWGNLIINRIKVFEKGGERWMSFPSETYMDGEQRKFFPYLRFEERKTSDAFQKKFFICFDKYVEDQMEQKPKQDFEQIPF